MLLNLSADEPLLLSRAGDFGLLTLLESGEESSTCSSSSVSSDESSPLSGFSSGVRHLTDCLVLNGYAVVTVNGKAWQDNNWQKKIDEFKVFYPDVKLHGVVTIEYLTTDGIDGQVLVLQKIKV